MKQFSLGKRDFPSEQIQKQNITIIKIFSLLIHGVNLCKTDKQWILLFMNYSALIVNYHL